MKTIQENIETIQELNEKLSQHQLCHSLNDDGDKFFVTLPPGYKVEAVQASQTVGKARALELILNALDCVWSDKALGCPVIMSR